MDGIIWIDELCNTHELLVIHVKKIVLDARLISHIGLRLDAPDVARQTEAILIPHEVLGHENKLGCVHDLLRHLIRGDWVHNESVEALLTQLLLEKSDQMVAKLMDSSSAFLWVSHLEHHWIVLARDLGQEKEGIKVSSDLVQVRRVKDRLDAVKVKSLEVRKLQIVHDV